MRFSTKRFPVLVTGFLIVAAVWYGAGSVFPRQIVLEPGRCRWAKDSSAVFYVKDDPPRICRYDVKTRLTRTYHVPREVVGVDRSVYGIDPSPDGREVVLMASRPNGVSPDYVYILNLADGRAKYIRTLPSAGYNIAWLNNNTIVYGSVEFGTWLLGPDRKSSRRLTVGSGLDDVSSDGSAFTCYTRTAKWLFSADGQQRRVLATKGGRASLEGDCVFASAKRCLVLPDGSDHLISSPCLDVRTGAVTEVMVPSYHAAYVKVSPDGRWAVYETFGSTSWSWGPIGKPTLLLTPMPPETTKALNAP